jgi:hypothetical protein
MKAFSKISCIILVCFIISGCPYETDVPLAQATEKVNPKLLGTWNEEHFEFKINKQDEFNYIYYIRNKYTNDYADTSIAYTTTINGVTFLNVNRENEYLHSKYYQLYKIEIKGEKELRLFPVTSDIPQKFTSSDSLKIFVGKSFKRPGFFEGPILLTRVP